MTRLYRARTILDEFEGHEKVPVAWYVCDRTDPIAPYEELIEGYDGKNPYTEDAVDECFTAEEVEALRRYLKEHYGDDIEVEEVPLPVPSNLGGYEALGIKPFSGEGNINLHAKEGYSLPFRVRGFFDLSERAGLSERGYREVKRIIDQIQQDLSPIGKKEMLEVLKQTDAFPGLFVLLPPNK